MDHADPIPLVAIHDPADRARRVVIRESDFDSAHHVAWGSTGKQGESPAPIVAIPDNWRELPWFSLRALALKFGPAGNSDEAQATIKAEIVKRAMAPAVAVQAGDKMVLLSNPDGGGAS